MALRFCFGSLFVLYVAILLVQVDVSTPTDTTTAATKNDTNDTATDAPKATTTMKHNATETPDNATVHHAEHATTPGHPSGAENVLPFLSVVIYALFVSLNAMI